MPTLAELRAQTGPKPLPKAKRTVTLVEGQHLLARSQQLTEERTDLLVRAERDRERAEDDGRDRTQKAGAKPEPTVPPRVAEIDDELATIVDQLADFQGEVDLCGMSGGDWQRYKDEHPARPDNDADARFAGNLCDTSALFADLGRFVVGWDGEPLAKGDWDGFLAERITYADRRDLVRDIVELHEERLPRVPKSQSSSSATEPSGTD